MEMDASNHTYSAVLTQQVLDNLHHPIVFFSKSMNPAERNYSISDKEALAIVKALQHWRHWLECTKEPVDIITNHQNLEYFKQPRQLNCCQLQWLEQLTHFNYKIGYCPGSKNSAVDALSCRAELCPEIADEEEPHTLFPLDKFAELAVTEGIPMDQEMAEICLMTDAELAHLIGELTIEIPPDQWPPDFTLGPDLLLYHDATGRVWVQPNEDLKRDLVAALHDSPLASHLGIEGTHELVTRKYTWEKVHDYVRRYVQGCHICTQNKNPNWKPAGQLQPLPVPDGPWLWTQSDFITQLPL